jgi:hypothetical protein
MRVWLDPFVSEATMRGVVACIVILVIAFFGVWWAASAVGPDPIAAVTPAPAAAPARAAIPPREAAPTIATTPTPAAPETVLAAPPPASAATPACPGNLNALGFARLV